MRRSLARRFAMALIPACAAGAAMLLLACGAGSKPRAVAATGAVNLSLRDITGRKLELSSLRGKVVLVDIWATWCAPCRRTIPDLIKISKRRPEDVVVVGILTADEPGRLKGFLDTQPIPYFVGIGDERTEAAFPAPALPTLFVVSREGKVVERLVGAHGEAEVWGIVETRL